MNKLIVILGIFLTACTTISVPKSFTYREIKTPDYTLASWQKITDKKAPVRIYIEGDGHAFNHAGQPTSDPTPKGTFLRQIAFQDPNLNVVYLARPCQYVKDKSCTQIDWTTGRFSQKIIDSVKLAIHNIASDRPIILIGYSGGALVSGLVIHQNPDLRIQKWLTLAGVLNHTKWTESLKLPPLKDSLDLKSLPLVVQHHYVGDKDNIVSADLIRNIAPKNVTVIPGATHDKGFDEYLSEIYH